MRPTDPEDGLNSSQKRHLLTSCEYADKLLSEIEAVLLAASSKSPFPRFKGDIAPAQTKVVQDYVARMRGDCMFALLPRNRLQPHGRFLTLVTT